MVIWDAHCLSSLDREFLLDVPAVLADLFPMMAMMGERHQDGLSMRRDRPSDGTVDVLSVPWLHQLQVTCRGGLLGAYDFAPLRLATEAFVESTASVLFGAAPLCPATEAFVVWTAFAELVAAAAAPLLYWAIEIGDHDDALVPVSSESAVSSTVPSAEIESDDVFVLAPPPQQWAISAVLDGLC